MVSNFAGIRWYNLQELLTAREFSITSSYLKVKLLIKKCTIDIPRRFGMRSEENLSKYGEPTVGSSFTKMLQHTSQFGQGFPSREQRDNTRASPTLSGSGCSRVSSVPRMKSRLKGQSFCDATDIIKNATEELKRLPQTGFQECFQHLYSCYQKCIVT